MDNFEWSLDIPSDSGLPTPMMMRQNESLKKRVLV